MVPLAFAGLAVYFSFTFVRDSVVTRGESPDAFTFIEPTQTPAPPPSPEQGMDFGLPLQPKDGPPPRPWDGSSPVNLLLLGMDSRDWGADDDVPLADAIILVTVDPTNRTAGMVNIPRDLWIQIPGFGYDKINRAYLLGQANQSPGGGAGLTVAAVENLFDIPISFYALIDFNAFVRLIDEIEGVKVEVPGAIRVDPLGDHNTKTLQPGIQTLPGDLALAYVRAPNLPESNLDRVRRQQDVLLGVRKRILEFEILPDLVARAPALYDEIDSGVATNLNLQQVFQFIWLATRIPPENIVLEKIGPGQMILMTTREGNSILRPIPEEIFKLRDGIFLDKPSLEPQIGAANSGLAISDENAVIELRNGTTTPGLAARTLNYLEENDISVTKVDNADQVYAHTTLIDYAGKPYTVEFLADLLGVSPGKIFHRFDLDNDVDIVIILGEDWAENNL